MASGEGSKQQPAAHAVAAWTRSGLMKGPGIPPPSGLYEVGCVDVMLGCKREDAAASNAADPDTVLMRLFYPTNTSRATTDDYAKWFPHPKYVGAYADSQGWKVSALWSSMMKSLTTPRTPALLAAALIGGPSKAAAEKSKAAAEKSKPDEPVSDVDKAAETTNADQPPTGSGESEETGGKETEERNLEPAEAEKESTSSSLPGPFPVIVFSHEARHMRTAYSGICCDLASHGYVVACMEHRDQSACLSLRKVLVGTPKEGQQPRYREEWIEYQANKNASEQLQFRVKEVEKALDLLEALNEGKEMVNLLGGGHFDLLRFKNQLRVDTIAAIGHSLGGATVVQSLFKDKRIKCGIGLDALLSPAVPDEVFLEGVEQPLLFVNSFSFLTVETIRLMQKLEKEPDETTKFPPCQILTIKGTVSQSLSDVFFALPDLFVTGSQPPVNPQTVHSLVAGLCRAFLKRFLLTDLVDQEETVPNLDGGEGASEHILFGTNVQEPKTATATPKTSDDQPGLEGPVENGATVAPEASPNAANLEEESKDKQQQQQQQEQEGGELEKVEQHSEAQEGTGEGAGEKETHPESLHVEQPKEETQLIDQSADEHTSKLTEQEMPNVDDEPQPLEVKPQTEEDQPQPDEEKPQPDEDQHQTDEDKPQPDEDQHQPTEGKPELDEPQPQPDEPQPQPDEPQPQPDEHQPQPDEDQPHPAKDQSQVDDDQSQVDDDQPQPEEGGDDKEKSIEKEEQPRSSEVEDQTLQQNEKSPDEGNRGVEETHGSGSTEEQHSEEPEEHKEKSEA